MVRRELRFARVVDRVRSWEGVDDVLWGRATSFLVLDLVLLLSTDAMEGSLAR